MKIALSGSNGFVGTALKEFFLKNNHEVVLLKRKKDGDYRFSPSDFEGVDAVINLAGASVSKKWTEDYKKQIIRSRINTTKELSSVLNSLKTPVKTVINASAIGFYGGDSEKIADETSPAGNDFLSRVVSEWEQSLNVPGSRTVFARFGIILSPQGGALKKMLVPFKLGLGGKLGSGNQYMSWVALEDAIGAINHILADSSIHGPVNIVSPYPVTNAVFTKTLGNALNRPTFLPVPAIAIKLIFGQMGEELLLSGARAVPEVLLKTGYPFIYSTLETALKSQI